MSDSEFTRVRVTDAHCLSIAGAEIKILTAVPLPITAGAGVVVVSGISATALLEALRRGGATDLVMFDVPGSSEQRQ